MRSVGSLLVASLFVGCGAFGAAEPDPASTSDAGTLRDGGSLEGSTSQARSPCADEPAGVFCDDFEHPATGPKLGWTDSFTGEGIDATASIEDGNGAQGTRGLRVKVGGSAGAAYWLRYALPADAKPASESYELELDFKVTSWNASYGLVAGLWFITPDGATLAAIGGEGGGSVDVVTSAPDPSSPSDRLFLGTWHHVAIQLTPAANGQHDVHVTVSGAVLLDAQLDLRSARYPDVRIGFYYSGGDAFDGIFDNVVVRRRP